MKKLNIMNVRRVYDCDDGKYKHHAALDNWKEDLRGRLIIVEYPSNNKILGKILNKNMYESIRGIGGNEISARRNKERYFWLGSVVYLLSKSEESGYLL